MAMLVRQTKWLCNWKTWENIPFTEAGAYLAKLRYTMFHAYNRDDGVRVMYFDKPGCATIYRLEVDLSKEPR